MGEGKTCTSQLRLVTLWMEEISTLKYLESRLWNCLLSVPCHQAPRKRQQPWVNIMLAAGGAGGLTQTPRNDTLLTGAQEKEVLLRSFSLYQKVFSAAVSHCTTLFKKWTTLKIILTWSVFVLDFLKLLPDLSFKSGDSCVQVVFITSHLVQLLFVFLWFLCLF